MAKLPEPQVGETLSSWMWRVNATSRVPFLSCARFTSGEREELNRKTWGINGNRFADRDRLTENSYIEDLKRVFKVSQTWLNKRFPEFNHPVIPTQFRKAFCSDCFMESFQQFGIPVCKMQWCYLTKPLCDLHEVPLHDSSEFFVDDDDYTVQAFVSYWDDPSFKEHCDLIRHGGEKRTALALKVQRRLHNLLRRASTSGESFKVEMFVVTLMRAMLMPTFHYAYPRIAFHFWGGSDQFASLGFYGNFFQEIYRSTCLARIYALYFSGIVLGWITSEHARKTLHEGYLAPWHADMIWSKLDERAGLLTLIFSELKLYQTSYLNCNDFYIPELIRMRLDE
jgi:hypothetical protein